MNVEPRLKPDGYGSCECGHDRCLVQTADGDSRVLELRARFGRLRKPRKDGTRHVYDCRCPSCTGKRNRDKGDRRATKARKALGISGVNSRHEEVWGGNLRVESKAGAQCKPAVTAFERCEAQSEAARPVGDTRPFAAILSRDGSGDAVFACRLSQVHEVAAAVLENLAAEAS